MKRRCIHFTGKQAVELVTTDIPDLANDQVLVQTTRSLISTGTEMTVFNRNFAPGTHWEKWAKCPFEAGYLASGRVVCAGNTVQSLRPGDRVATRGHHCSHSVLNACEVLAVPDAVSDEEAAWMGLGKITQIGVRAAEHRLGDSVAVIGLGLLGQLVVQYARLSGAAQVIAIDTAPRRLQMAELHGATMIIAATAADARETLLAATNGRGADVVYEVTGHPAVLAQALGLARKHGTIVLLGDAGSPGQQALSGDLITRGLRVVGAHDSLPPPQPTPPERWSGREMFELFLTYLARRQIVVSDLITHRFAPENAAEAYALLNRERATAMGVIFEWE